MSTNQPVPPPAPDQQGQVQPAAGTPDVGSLENASSADVGENPVLAPPTTRGRAWVLPVVTGIIGVVVGAGALAGIGQIRDAATERGAARVAALAQASAQASAKSATAAKRAVLTGAVSSCKLMLAPGIELGDGGTTLTFDVKGDEELTGASYEDVVCIFGALKMPSNVSSHVDQTTSLDGRQEEKWAGITMAWTYHPDRGLDGVLTVDATA